MKKQLKIGQLNHLITILQHVTVVGTAGGNTPTEVEYKKTWALVDDISGSEAIDGKIIATNVRKYTIGYDQTVFTDGDKMAVSDTDGVYDIQGIAQLEYKKYLVLKCIKRE